MCDQQKENKERMGRVVYNTTGELCQSIDITWKSWSKYTKARFNRKLNLSPASNWIYEPRRAEESLYKTLTAPTNRHRQRQEAVRKSRKVHNLYASLTSRESESRALSTLPAYLEKVYFSSSALFFLLLLSTWSLRDGKGDGKGKRCERMLLNQKP